MPPSLSYKSKAQREQDERERREREEAERLEAERLETQRAAARRQEEADRAKTLQAPPTTPAQAQAQARAPAPIPPPASSTPPLPVAPADDDGPRPSVQDPKSLVMFREDGLTPVRREIDDIEMLGGHDDDEVEEEAEEEEDEEVEEAVKRSPPRPPKSPDMRPVAVGFILVFTGISQFIYGVWTMLHSPEVTSGPWAPIVQWGAFSLGFTAAFLGLLAVRGGLWSFRKERFSVVKAGAIAATVCVWAWWIPWLFGLAALILVTRAREEYYPFYNPRWDSPEWVRPPPGSEDEVEGDQGEVESGEGMLDDHPKEPVGRDHLDDVSPEGAKEAGGIQDAALGHGDGWEDID